MEVFAEKDNEPGAALQQRLADPETARALNRLLDRAGDLEKLLTMTADLAKSAPNLAAIATDTVDEACRQASEQGIFVEQRLQGLMRLLLKLTEPETVAAAEGLLGRLAKLDEASKLIDDLPNLIAMAMDVFDEWSAKLKEDGIDLEASLRQGLRAALWLGAQIRQDELERLGFLLRSDVLNPHSVEAVGMAGTALATCQQGVCQHPVPKRVGMLGMLSALRDPDTQRAIAFGVQFAKCFGNTLTERQDPVDHAPGNSHGASK
jgi:hypothetical protein